MAQTILIPMIYKEIVMKNLKIKMLGVFAFFAYALMSSAHAEMTMYFIHNDHLGTPQVVTDENQSVVWQADYQPFGEVDIVTNQIEQNARFPGQYTDDQTGLYYNYFRDYDPTIGRYIQSDPIGLNGGQNTYGYAGANPAIYMDIYGLAYYPWWHPGHGNVTIFPSVDGNPIQAWIADTPDDRAEGCSNDPIPPDADVDFIYVDGEWYKIKALGAFIGVNRHTGETTVSGVATYKVGLSTQPYVGIVDGGEPEYIEHIQNHFGSLDPSAKCGCQP